MKYVYLLESVAQPDRKYVGLTEDFARRLNEHNSKKSPYSSKYAPWRDVVAPLSDKLF